MPRPRVFNDLTVIALDDGDGPCFELREDAFPSANASLWAEADRRDPTSRLEGDDLPF